MLHHWTKGCDGNGATVRVTLYDYEKAFDLIDHRILVNKLCKLDLPTEIINWIIDFLRDRSQRIKLSEGCYSEWGSVPSGVPQGTKLGPWLFLVLINDLEINNAGNIWKYVDDTTTSEIVVKGASSNSQLIADTVVQWSFENRVKLNSEKCKELRISFANNKPQLAPIVVNNQELECVESAKLLGVTISNNLTWNMHIDQIIKKASKRMYFLIQLKRANVARHELILFYTSCIRSVMTYASPAFFYALPLYLKKDLENVEKRALSIICPGLAYRKALELSNIMSINDYIASLCKKTFLSIANDPAHRLHNMLQSSGPSCYNLRCKRRFAIPKCKTERFKNSFLVRSCIDNEF